MGKFDRDLARTRARERAAAEAEEAQIIVDFDKAEAEAPPALTLAKIERAALEIIADAPAPVTFADIVRVIGGCNAPGLQRSLQTLEAAGKITNRYVGRVFVFEATKKGKA